jgi:hypothetical protein
MSYKIFCLLVIAFLLISVVPVIAPPGPQPSSPSGPTGSSSSSSSRLPDLDSFIIQVQSWKDYQKDKFEVLQKMLYKPAYTSVNYTTPDVWLNWTSNRTINRTDSIKIEAIIQDLNPKEIRRAQYLTLEIQEPGESKFKPVANAAVQIIQKNDYIADGNTTRRVFPEVNSLRFLKRVGEVKFRVSWTDGEYPLNSSREGEYSGLGYHYFPVLVLKVKNIPPRINNSTMNVYPNPARWDGFMTYSASFEKRGQVQSASHDGNGEEEINTTIHVYDEISTTEIFTQTERFRGNDVVIFSTRNQKIFNENDAGKNFTYRFSCTDNIKGGPNTTWSELKPGPSLKRSAKIIVAQPSGQDAEDQNNYWWHKYHFSVNVKAKDPDIKDVQVTLRTNTPDHPGQIVASPNNPLKLAVTADDYTTFEFKDVTPFNVLDCGKNYSYYFEYNVEDEMGNRTTDLINGGMINGRVLYYTFISFEVVGNLLALLIASLLIGVLLERSIFRKGGV